MRQVFFLKLRRVSGVVLINLLRVILNKGISEKIVVLGIFDEDLLLLGLILKRKFAKKHGRSSSLLLAE
jgi:hypothetical protein